MPRSQVYRRFGAIAYPKLTPDPRFRYQALPASVFPLKNTAASMNSHTWRFVAFLMWTALSAAASHGEPVPEQNLAAQMRTGGYVILMRHASSPATLRTPAQQTLITQTSNVNWMRQGDPRRWPWAKLCGSYGYRLVKSCPARPIVRSKRSNSRSSPGNTDSSARRCRPKHGLRQKRCARGMATGESGGAARTGKEHTHRDAFPQHCGGVYAGICWSCGWGGLDPSSGRPGFGSIRRTG